MSENGKGISRRSFLAGTGGLLALAACSSSSGGAKPSGSSAGGGGGGGGSNADVDKAIAWAKTNLPNSTPEIIQGAAKEGHLTLSMPEFGDSAFDAMIKQFNVHYPFIKVEYTTMSTTPLLKKLATELSSKHGVGDYWALGTPYDAQHADSVQNFSKFVISQDSAFSAANKGTGQFAGHWYGWHKQYAVTAYRKGALSDDEKQLIRTFKGLADPRFKGRIGSNDIGNGSTQSQVYGLLYDFDKSWFEGIGKNKPVVQAASAALMDGLLSGQYDIAVLSALATTSRTAKTSPVEFVITQPAVNIITPGVISAVGPHPNAAKLWQDWALSKEGQTIWQPMSGDFSVRDDITAKQWYRSQPWFYDDPSQHHDIDWNQFGKRSQDIVDQFNSTFK